MVVGSQSGFFGTKRKEGRRMKADPVWNKKDNPAGQGRKGAKVHQLDRIDRHLPNSFYSSLPTGSLAHGSSFELSNQRESICRKGAMRAANGRRADSRSRSRLLWSPGSEVDSRTTV